MIPEDKDHFRSGGGWERAIALEQVPKVRPLIRRHFTNEGNSLLHEYTPAAASSYLWQRKIDSKCIPLGRELSSPPPQVCRVSHYEKGLHFSPHKGGWKEVVPEMDETWHKSTFGFYTTFQTLFPCGEAPTTASGSLWVLGGRKAEWGLWWLGKLKSC